MALPGVLSSHGRSQPPKSACSGQALTIRVKQQVSHQPVVPVCSPPASLKFRPFRATCQSRGSAQRGLGGSVRWWGQAAPPRSSTHPWQSRLGPAAGVRISPGEERAPLVSLASPLVSAPYSVLRGKRKSCSAAPLACTARDCL